MKLYSGDNITMSRSMTIAKRIQLLPKEVQILIGEYNPEHRILTKQLKKEYFTMIYKECRICHAPFELEFCPIDYFIIRKYKINSHWCTIDCFQLDKDKKEKRKCLSAFKDYFQEKE